MRRSLLTLAAACVLLVPAAWHAPSAHALAAPADGQSARVIVKLRPGGALMRAQAAADAGRAGIQQAATLSRRVGVALTDGRPIGRHAQVVFAQGISSAELAARLAADGDVEYAEPDRRRRALAVPNDPLYAGGQQTATPAVGQWYLRPPASDTLSAINAQQAWDITAGTSGVVVAVLDTGVRFDHPDLVGKLHQGFDFIADVKTANDGNGRDADASDPGDWVTQAEIDGDPLFRDCVVENSSWHGTQVTGLVGAATQNSVGMASVGRNVMVLPVRVLGKCGGFDSDIQAAMLWSGGVSANPAPNPTPARVVNLSLGSPGACTQGYRDVVAQLAAARVTVVASAGNDRGLAVSTPANCPGVVAVAGVRNIGTKVGFSDVGPEATVAAPGGNCINVSGADPCLYPILTTSNAGTTAPGAPVFSDSFHASVGTSFSAPLVAGTVALMVSVQPTLTPAQVIAALEATARPFPTSGAAAGVPVCHAPDGNVQDECYCTTGTCGAGLLDAAAAVAAVAPALAPHVPLATSTPVGAPGTTVALDALLATAAPGRTLAFQWTVSDPAVAAFAGPTNTSTASLLLQAPGAVTATVTVTDDAGLATAASAIITATGTPAPPPAADDGGGGAIGLLWLALLAAAVPVAARRPGRR